MITGKLYNYLKWLAQVVLPGLGFLYAALAGLWGLPAALEVSGTIFAIDTFLGSLLGISQINYNKQVAGGELNLVQHSDGLTLQGTIDPESLVGKKEVRLQVNEYSVGRPTTDEEMSDGPHSRK